MALCQIFVSRIIWKIVYNRSNLIIPELKSTKNITGSSKIQETNIRCNINNFSNGILKGWAINDQSIDHPVKLHVFVNSQFDGSALCNLYRNDLENNKVGDGKGCYAFEYNIQTNYQDQEVIEIECKTDKDTSIKYGRSASALIAIISLHQI